MKRQAGCVVSAGALEGAARFHFEHVIHAVAVLIDPSTDRVARVSRSGVEVRGPVAPIGVDSTKRLSAAGRDIGGFRRYDEFHGSKSDSHERHAARHAANGMVKKIALSAVGLVRKAVLEDLLILGSERGFLSSPPGLGLVVRRLAAGREATIRFKRGAWGKPARPRAFPVRVPRVVCGLTRAHHDPGGYHCDGYRARRASRHHDVLPRVA